MHFEIAFIHLGIFLTFFQTVMLQFPIISYISNDQFTIYGVDVEFQCLVKNADGYLVRWIKVEDKGPPIIVTEGLVVRDSRYFINRKNDYNVTTYSLQIIDFQKSDEAIYQCVLILQPDLQMMSQVELRAKKHPHIDFISHDIECRMGETIRLECYGSGVPEPIISWRRKGSRPFANGDIIYRNNIVTIFDVIELDDGVYFCQVQNKIDESEVRNVTVSVVFP